MSTVISMNESSKPLTYRVAYWIAGHKLLATGIVILGVTGTAVLMDGVWQNPGPGTPVIVNAATSKVPLPDPLDKLCGAGLDAQVKSAKVALDKRDFRAANAALDRCASRMAKDSDAYKTYLKANGAFTKQLDAEQVAERKSELARKKKEGVRLGMSEQDALDSSWGKPMHINTTTNAIGTHAQWVYGNGYLYFTDGVLTSVQN